MTSADRDPFMLEQFRSLHDSAIRSYYTYELLRKLIRSQARSVWEEISTPLGIVASVISIFAFVESPPSRNLVIVVYAVAMLVVVGAPIIERRYRGKNGLDDITYLGIYLDQVAKYVYEMKLASTWRKEDQIVTDFIDDTEDVLRGILTRLQDRIRKLEKSK